MALPPALGSVSFINSLASSFNVGVSALPNALTNGYSNLGALSAASLSPYIKPDDQKLESRDTLPPWGYRTVYTDPSDIPQTNVTRYYDLVVARCTLAPDGTQKDMICINDQFPGPTISANWGDNLEVTVHNELSDPEDGTALHWHGYITDTARST